MSSQGKISYAGYFSSGDHSMPNIHLDLTADELMVMPPEDKSVFHEYSDEPSEGIFVRAYPHEKIFAEKIRALGERARPRDLYDVVNLYRSDDLQRPEPAKVIEILVRKCAYKGISVSDLASIKTRQAELQQNWNAMLIHQLPALPPLHEFWDVLPEFFT